MVKYELRFLNSITLNKLYYHNSLIIHCPVDAYDTDAFSYKKLRTLNNIVLVTRRYIFFLNPLSRELKILLDDVHT